MPFSFIDAISASAACSAGIEYIASTSSILVPARSVSGLGGALRAPLGPVVAALVPRCALLIWKVLSRSGEVRLAGGQRGSWSGSGHVDGDHSDMRGSAEPVPHDSEPSPRCPSHFLGRGSEPQRSARGFSAISASSDRDPRCRPPGSCRDGYLLLTNMTGGPDETRQLAGDRGECLERTDARTEMPIAGMQADLGTQGQVDELRRHVFLALLDRAGDAGCTARMVGRLAQHVAQQAVAGLGNRSALVLAATGRLRGHDPSVGHELGCGTEAAQITRFGHQGDRTQEADAAEGLQGADEGHLTGALGALVQSGFETFDPFASGVDFGQVVSEHD